MRSFRKQTRAFTLVEIMIVVGIIGVTGLGVVEILRVGTILFNKNTSMNLSHSQSRNGLLRLQEDLHSAISSPELSDSTGAIISGTFVGPAAGVSFQSYAGGPFALYVPAATNTLANGATSVQVVTGTQGASIDYKPLVGQTLHIQTLPTSLMELQVTGVAGPSSTSSGTVYTLTVAGGLSSAITLVSAGMTLNVACYLSTPVIYTVQNQQLVCIRLDSGGNQVTTVISRDIPATALKPFSMPTVNSSAENTFVSVSNFTAVDPYTSLRGYLGVTTPMTVQVPHFAQLTSKY